MPHAGFVHLRVHTAYSLSEGAIRIPDLVAACRAGRMPAVAIADTDNLFGAMEFSRACAEAGVQPVIGCQLSVSMAPSEEPGGGADGGTPRAPVVLLVKDEAGYRNLLKLLSAAYLTEGGAHQPQVPVDALAARNEGLVLLTGGPAGPLGRLLLQGRRAAAERWLQRLAGAFAGRLYVELSRLGAEDEARIEAETLELADGLDLPLVATNEAFFLGEDMYEAHDALLCVAEGAYVREGVRRRLTPDHRLKSPDEMRALFADLPEAVDNTLVIARRCAFLVGAVDPILPPFPCGEGRSEAEELKAQARDGLERRLHDHVFADGLSEAARERAARPYRRRLDYELGVIVEMGFAGYFLIVSEFIQWAKSQGIPVGPGRGSGAGSVVSWALTITDLDPLRFGLLFERFLNPERVSMPDFDIDFCQDRRDEVIRHVQGLYGRDRVAQIITFGKLQARAVLRDVGRVLDMPYSQVDRICKMVPNNPASPVTLERAVESDPQLQDMIREDAAVARLFALARKLEGLNRHASTHAAGVVIGDRPLDELIPLYRDPRSDMPVSGFSMKYVEAAGLVKFDFLGLKTLTVLANAVALLAARGVKVDLAALPLDDGATFEMLGRGDATGVFQLESAGMRDVLRRLKPDTFEDIIAVVSLYRPGPMDNIPSFIRRKHGEEPIDYLYPSLEGILKETYGIIIYQEQVMQIAQELSGYSLGAADILRWAMGKKVQAEMDEQRQSFVEGAVARGVPEARASHIFDLVAKFGGYGFNKSHAASYALLAYQTAYLKTHHPVEFMAAVMSLDIHNPDRLNATRQALERLGIRLLPPDVNLSGAMFTVETSAGGAIRYALAAIRNAGTAAMQALVAEREANGPYKDLFDVTERLDSRLVNRRLLETLSRAGALDGLNGNRRQAFEAAELLVRHGQGAASERNSGQFTLFGDGALQADRPALPAVDDWSAVDRLRQEFDAIGFYLSAHPLDAYGHGLARSGVRPSREILAEGRSGTFRLAGTVISRKERTSRNGGRFAWVQFSDPSGVFEVTVFSELLTQCRGLLEVGQAVLVRASVQFEGEAGAHHRPRPRAPEAGGAAAGQGAGGLRRGGRVPRRTAGYPGGRGARQRQPPGAGPARLPVGPANGSGYRSSRSLRHVGAHSPGRQGRSRGPGRARTVIDATPPAAQPGFLTIVTVCVAPRRSIRQERAEGRSGDYGRGPRRLGRAPGRDPKGGAVRPTGCVEALARCPTSRGAPLLPCRPDSAAQTMTMVRKPG